MILELFAAIIGLQPHKKRDYYYVACSGGDTEESNETGSIIDELAKADPETIEAYCEKVVFGHGAGYSDLAKALPTIQSIVTSPNFCSTDRTRIHDSLKRVFFNVELERTSQANLFETIQRISNA